MPLTFPLRAGFPGPALAAAAASLAVALAAVPVVIWAARRMGWVAHPKADRWHSDPTALMGGVGIYAGATAGWLLAGGGPQVWLVWAAATLMFATGVVDDIRDVSPATKLAAQLVAGSLLFYGGFRLELHGVAWLSFPLTLLWVIGVTNAVNLLDNMDGLAAGVSAIAAAATGTLLGLGGNHGGGALAWAVSGAALGFLVYNFNPARVFMGDCGSLFLGFSIAALSLPVPSAGRTSGVFLIVLVPAAVMAVPIFDTTLVTAKRILSGRPVSQGGRDHSSHRLVWLGLSERRAVLTLYAVSASFGALAVAFAFVDAFLFYPLLALAVTALVVFGVFLAEVKVYEPEVEQRSLLRLKGLHEGDSVLLRAVLRNKRQVFGLAADAVVIVSSLVIAYYLRFDARIPAGDQRTLVQALPVVLAAKVFTFFLAGMYRRMWRFTGSREIVAIVRTSALASMFAVSLVVLLFRFGGYSRTVFIIDWMVATVAVVALRTGLRGMRGYFSAHRTGGTRVLLYGAGGGGSLAVRELAHNPQLRLVPVGFLDDDQTKHRLHLHGLRVVGGAEDLARLRVELDVEEVIVTTRDLPAERLAAIRTQCERAGVRLRRLNVSIADLPASRAPGPAPGTDSGAPTVALAS